MATHNQSKNYKQYASGRDGTNGTNTSGTGRVKDNETSSSRGIVYPEDIELQGDSDSDKGVRPNRTSGHQLVGTPYGTGKLGLKPEVRTEIASGLPRSSMARGNRGIEVKRDVHVTEG